MQKCFPTLPPTMKVAFIISKSCLIRNVFGGKYYKYFLNRNDLI